MKRIAGIVLLLLLLYNMLGLSVAVLCLENDFQRASPLTSGSDIKVLRTYLPSLSECIDKGDKEMQDGLYRVDDQLYNITGQVYENDTLYVTLRSNASAWQRFSELSEMMQEASINTSKKASHPVSKAIKLLHDLLKVYLPVQTVMASDTEEFTIGATKITFDGLACFLVSETAALHSPPPEVAWIY